MGQQAVPGCAHSSLRLKRLDCAGQRERDVAEGGRGVVLPVRTVMGKPKPAKPALTVSLSPASSLLFFFPFKGKTEKEEAYCESRGM